MTRFIKYILVFGQFIPNINKKHGQFYLSLCYMGLQFVFL